VEPLYQVDIPRYIFALGNAASTTEDTEANVVNHNGVLRGSFDSLHRDAPIVIAFRIAGPEHNWA
jgi:hypothetical protein